MSESGYFAQFFGKEPKKVWIVQIHDGNEELIEIKCHSRNEAEEMLKKYSRKEYPHQQFYEDWDTE